MSHRVRQAVLRILLLRDEFSPEELAEAAALIEEQKNGDLLTFLKRLSEEPLERVASRPRKREFSRRGETRALQELKHADSEKYEVLRQFETLVREGGTLKTLDDFRAFGKILGKEFFPGKSRKEALARLMALLAQMDLDAIRSALARVPTSGTEEANAFQRLADKIISGTNDRSPRSTTDTQ